MKKLFAISILAMLLVAGCGYLDFNGKSYAAEEIVADDSVTAIEWLGIFKASLDNLGSGVFYSVDQKQLSVVTTGTLVSKETKIGTFNLDGGYGTSDLGIVALTYSTATLEKVGVKVPVLKDLFARVGYGAGWDGISKSDRKFVHGPEAALGGKF